MHATIIVNDTCVSFRMGGKDGYRGSYPLTGRRPVGRIVTYIRACLREYGMVSAHVRDHRTTRVKRVKSYDRNGNLCQVLRVKEDGRLVGHIRTEKDGPFTRVYACPEGGEWDFIATGLASRLNARRAGLAYLGQLQYA